MRILLEFGYPGKFGSYPLMPGVLSVEEVLLNAIGTVFNVDGDAWSLASHLQWESASRTDRGVGALSNVGAFTIQGEYHDIASAINGISNLTLRDDVFIRSFALVDENFSPRRDAHNREYRFFLIPGTIGNEERAHEALEAFRGKHDFSLFSKRDKSRRVDPYCTIQEIVLLPWGDGYILDVIADRFLWNMIRKITKSIVDVSYGKVSVKLLEDALTGQGKYRPGTHSAHGLYLWRIGFDNKIEREFREIDGIRRIKRNMVNSAYLERAWIEVLENMGGFRLP